MNDLTNSFLSYKCIKHPERQALFNALEGAYNRLESFTVNVTVRNHKPTYGKICFMHQNLNDYDLLKTYVGEFGFVVPVQATTNKRILK